VRLERRLQHRLVLENPCLIFDLLPSLRVNELAILELSVGHFVKRDGGFAQAHDGLLTVGRISPYCDGDLGLCTHFL